MTGTGETTHLFNKGNILPNDNVSSVGNTIFENRIQYGQVGGKKMKKSKKTNKRTSTKSSGKKSNKKTTKKCKKLFWFF